MLWGFKHTLGMWKPIHNFSKQIRLLHISPGRPTNIISYTYMVLRLLRKCRGVKKYFLWMIYVHVLSCLDMCTSHTPSTNLKLVYWFQVKSYFLIYLWLQQCIVSLLFCPCLHLWVHWLVRFGRATDEDTGIFLNLISKNIYLLELVCGVKW